MKQSRDEGCRFSETVRPSPHPTHSCATPVLHRYTHPIEIAANSNLCGLLQELLCVQEQQNRLLQAMAHTEQRILAQLYAFSGNEPPAPKIAPDTAAASAENTAASAHSR